MTIRLWGRRPRAVTARDIVSARLFDAVPHSGRKLSQKHQPRWGDQVTPVASEGRRRHSHAASIAGARESYRARRRLALPGLAVY
jgi:hypothetical protein